MYIYVPLSIFVFVRYTNITICRWHIISLTNSQMLNMNQHIVYICSKVLHISYLCKKT